MSRYKHVNVDGKTVAEHRLVWEAAHGPIPKGYEIHHKDGNSKNNALENLMCMTRSAHRRLHLELKAKGMDVVDKTDPEVIKDHKRVDRWVKEHPEQFSVTQKRYRHAHPEVARAWRAEHKDELREKKNTYRHEHIEENRKYHRGYYAEHKDAIKASYTHYNETHRGLIRARQNLRNAKLRGDPPERISELEKILQREKDVLQKKE